MFKFLRNLFKKNPRRKGRLFTLGVVMALSEKDKESIREARPEIMEYLEKFLNPKETAFTEDFDRILSHALLTSKRLKGTKALVLTSLLDSLISELSSYSGKDAREFIVGVKEILILV